MTTATLTGSEMVCIAAPGAVVTDAPRCATCDTPAEPSDNFCAECGTPLGEPASVAIAAESLAHAVTHEACTDMPRDRREVVAESVAYAVGSRFGLDMTLRSAHYVAAWLDEPETFKATMSAIHDGAASLSDALATARSGESLALAA